MTVVALLLCTLAFAAATFPIAHVTLPRAVTRFAPNRARALYESLGAAKQAIFASLVSLAAYPVALIARYVVGLLFVPIVFIELTIVGLLANRRTRVISVSFAHRVPFLAPVASAFAQHLHHCEASSSAATRDNDSDDRNGDVRGNVNQFDAGRADACSVEPLRSLPVDRVFVGGVVINEQHDSDADGEGVDAQEERRSSSEPPSYASSPSQDSSVASSEEGNDEKEVGWERATIVVPPTTSQHSSTASSASSSEEEEGEEEADDEE